MVHGTTDYERIEKVIRHLTAARQSQPSLTDLAAVAGLSPSHFDRLFHRFAGVTPMTFLGFLTWKAARPLLRAKQPLLAAALDLGLSGESRLHDLFVRTERMTPGEYKEKGRGLTIAHARFDTRLGPALFAATERGLCALHFGEDAALPRLQAEWEHAAFVEDQRALGPYATLLEARLSGASAEPLPVLLRGTPFQLQVWEALLRIPEGQVVSYGQLAQAVGRPRAARAVGSAVGDNPVGYLIPCHRVIRATGAFDQYRWGPERKRLLLALERAR